MLKLCTMVIKSIDFGVRLPWVEILFSVCRGASLVAQLVKNLPALQETWVRFLGWEDPLEEEMATHSSILAWEIPWTEEPGGLQTMGLQRVGQDLAAEDAHGMFYLLG